MTVRPARVRALLAVVVLGGVALATACSHDGRELRPPGPDQTLSIVTTSSSVAPATIDATDPAAAELMTLTLPFTDGQTIADLYTCKGADVSPALSWTNVPDGTSEMALSVIDLDSDPPGFVHWVVSGLDPASGGLAEGAVPEQAVQALNGYDTPGWKGPCPPAGEHTYLFTLYALDSSPDIVDGQTGASAISAIEQRQIASIAIAGVAGATGTT